MANIIMSSIYNHYMSTYSPRKNDSRLDSHKTEELKTIYDNIIKMNKEAPLYLFDKSEATKNFAVSLKEDARKLQHTILTTSGCSEQDLFHSKVAYSTDENILHAEYIGNNKLSNDEIPQYEIEVTSLASPQINIGNFLPCGDQSLAPGTYAFNININNIGYEFQFNVNEDDMNIDLQSKLVRLFNHSNVGLHASIIDGINDTSAIRIVSSKTGDNGVLGKNIFTIEEHPNQPSTGSVDFFGLNYTVDSPTDAHFIVNGEEFTSPTNHLTISDTYEIDLFNITPDSGEPVTIGVKANTDAVKDNIINLVGGYNSFLQAVDKYQELKANRGKLSNELQSVVKLYYNELDAIGINTTETGSLAVDETLLSLSAGSQDAQHLLSPIKDFSSSLYEKGEQISRDPLNYVYKKIVAYKNPGRNFNTPYITSHYSGLLFNYYC